MEKSKIKPEQEKKVELLYAESQNWKSSLYLVIDEVTFIDNLLNSYVFEPNTPNLFERLQKYQAQIKKNKERKNIVLDSIDKHQKDLGGMLECTDYACDLGYYQKHEAIKAEVVGFLENFQLLKSEIFNYAGGILKKRKP
ncbi:hypothetical protein SB49_08225 [Sediminicola sp. YIK13]|uniref:hypothetical protein n=1 Tax=Sediminicola sp. YIK13 TaxID=1453352 RepID=UPI0007212011|nr:hypothetical protein [Sediminicola sp. YIK13]ALM07781.1 hypothetical protein SB49_08225 [Sediminicola sp. YIK13]